MRKSVVLFLLLFGMVYAQSVDRFIGLGSGIITNDNSAVTQDGTSGHLILGMSQEAGYGAKFEYLQSLSPIEAGATEIDYAAWQLFLTYKINILGTLSTKIEYGYLSHTMSSSGVAAAESGFGYGLQVGLGLFWGMELYGDYTVMASDLYIISGGINFHY